MAIYGYHRNESDSTSPTELSEVTFHVGAEDLRRLASFLIARASEMDQGVFVDGGRHLRDYDKQWDADRLGDVIVVPQCPGETAAG